MACRLVLFAREPSPGRVKTRLAAGTGDEGAVALYAAFLRDLAGALPGPWQSVVAHTAEAPGPRLDATFRPPWRFEPQGDGDLGQRLRRAFAAGRAAGCEATCVVGSDAPTLDAEIAAAAFEELGRVDAVLAPSPDGGYALVGLSGRIEPGPLFHDVRWSTAHALEDTKAGFAAAGLRVAELASVADVDVVEDLDPLRERLRERPGLAPETRRVLEAREAPVASRGLT